MFHIACIWCLMFAVGSLASYQDSGLARALYLARVRLAERVLAAWVREGWTHVGLRYVQADRRIGLMPVMESWSGGAVFGIDSKVARDLLVSSMALGVSYSDTDPIGLIGSPKPTVAADLYLELDREVS